VRASLDAEYTEYVQARLLWLRRVAYLLCQDWQGADDLVQAAITRLYTQLPGRQELGGTLGVLARLRFLGVNPANWTPTPLG
jgi:DNA-directed RNA polymerase specialized sigma24 family protein